MNFLEKLSRKNIYIYIFSKYLYQNYFYKFFFEEARSILINQTVNYQNVAQAFYLNIIYLILAISLFYYSFSQARKKGSLINIGK